MVTSVRSAWGRPFRAERFRVRASPLCFLWSPVKDTLWYRTKYFLSFGSTHRGYHTEATERFVVAEFTLLLVLTLASQCTTSGTNDVESKNIIHGWHLIAERFCDFRLRARGSRHECISDCEWARRFRFCSRGIFFLSSFRLVMWNGAHEDKNKLRKGMVRQLQENTAVCRARWAGRRNFWC